MIKEIRSRQNELVKEVAKLSDAKARKQQKLFKVEGFHMLEMAKETGLIHSVFTLKEIKDLESKIPQYLVSEEVLEKLSSTKTPQGVVCVCHLLNEKPIKSDKVLYLDDVSDPGNLGTILRTALAFGYDDVILSKNCCSIYNEKTLQSYNSIRNKAGVSTKHSLPFNYNLPGYRETNPHLTHQKHQGCTTIAYKRKGNTGIGDGIGGNRDVKDRLQCNMEHDADHQHGAKKILGVSRNIIHSVDNKAINQDQ